MRFVMNSPGILVSVSLSAALLLGAALSGCKDDPTGPAGNAKITLKAPTGGETFKVADTLRVKWTAKDDPEPMDNVDARFAPDSGKSWWTISPESYDPDEPAWGNFGWKIPDTLTIQTTPYPLAGNSKCMVR